MSSINGTLRIGFAVLLFLFIAQSAVGYFTARSNDDLVTAAINEDFNTSVLISRIAIEGNKLRRYEKEYFIYVGNQDKMAKYTGEWEDSYRKLKDMLNVAINDSTGAWTPEQQNVLRAWDASLEGYASGFRAVVQGVGNGEVTNTVAANVAVQDAKNKFRVLLSGAASSGTELYERAANSAREIKKTNDFTVKLFGATSLFGIALALWLFIVIPRAIDKPVSLLAETAQEMSTGNISLPVPVHKTPREFRTLADTLERMRISQTVLIQKLKAGRTAGATRGAA